MIYRILFYLLGLLLTSIGFSLIVIYLSYNNVGFTLFENIALIFKNPSTYLFLIGLIVALLALFYDLIKQKK